MPYPPALPPTTRANTTPQLDNHPGDHNMLTDAIASVIGILGVDPAGASADLTARLDTLMPVGSIFLWGTVAAPSGFLLLDGTPASRTGFPDLFARWGTNYGNGDGATTFGIPDARGCMVAMLHPGQTPFAALGGKGGSRDLIVVQHNHAGPLHQHDMGHDHPAVGTTTADFVRSFGGGDAKLYSQTSNPGITGYGPYNIGNGVIDVPPFGGLTGGAGNGVTSDAGASGVDKNLPPYITLNLIVKALA